MRNWEKILLITGAGLCAAGMLLFGVGALTGGNGYVSAADLNTMDGAAKLNDDGNAVVLDKTKLEDVKEVYTRLNDADLKVEESDDDNFYLSYSLQTKKGKNPLSYQVNNGKLQIEEKKGHGISNFINIDIDTLFHAMSRKSIIDQNNVVTLYVPKDVELDNFETDLDTSNLEIDHLCSRNMLVTLNVGDMDLSDMSIKKGSIKADDGHMVITDSSLSDVNIKSEIGDVTLTDCKYQDGSVKMQDGKLESQRTVFAGNVDITNNIGDISLNLNEDDLKDMSIDAKTDMGDLRVPERLGGKLTQMDDEASFKLEGKSDRNNLTIKAEDGNITVK